PTAMLAVITPASSSAMDEIANPPSAGATNASRPAAPGNGSLCEPPSPPTTGIVGSAGTTRTAVRRSSLFHAPISARSGSTRHASRSEEHTSELQSRENLVCRLLLEKKNECRRRDE